MLVATQLDTSIDILGTKIAPKMAIFGHFLTDFEMEVLHLQLLFPATMDLGKWAPKYSPRSSRANARLLVQRNGRLVNTCVF